MLELVAIAVLTAGILVFAWLHARLRQDHRNLQRDHLQLQLDLTRIAKKTRDDLPTSDEFADELAERFHQALKDQDVRPINIELSETETDT